MNGKENVNYYSRKIILSSRLADKVLLDLKGKPMIQRVYERACQFSIEDVYIATDSAEIQKVVSRFTDKVIMTSDKHKSGSDRVAEAAQKIDCDYIINLQGDEPLIDPALLNALEQKLRNDNLEMVTAAYPIHSRKDIQDTSKVKVVLDSTGKALYFSRSPIPYNQEFEGQYFCHLGVYAFRKDFLFWFTKAGVSRLEKMEKLEQLRVLDFGKSIYVIVTEKQSYGVDTEEDLQRVLKLI